MREKIRDKERLEHILNAIDVLIASREIHTLEEMMADPIVYFGIVKHVEIIGEAVYMLTKEFRAAHPEVNWRDIERMRHVLVHGYYHIRPQQVWDAVQQDIPLLKPDIERLLNEI